MTVIEDLKAAKAAIEEMGWFQGWLTDGQKICAVGALNVACYGVVVPNCFQLRDNWDAREAAYIALEAHLPKEFRQVAHFNDDPTTTKQDVLNLFDKALADLGGLA